MTRASLRHTLNHRDLLGLFRSSHRRSFVKKGVLKNFANFARIYLCWNLAAGLQVCNSVKKILQHWCFPMKFAKFLRTTILRNICERLLLFVSPQNTIKNSGGEFELDETSTECKVSFLNVTILFNQMQSYNLFVS